LRLPANIKQRRAAIQPNPFVDFGQFCFAESVVAVVNYIGRDL
jgi:hypothetical protein